MTRLLDLLEDSDQQNVGIQRRQIIFEIDDLPKVRHDYN